jgi:hypothetical protein
MWRFGFGTWRLCSYYFAMWRFGFCLFRHVAHVAHAGTEDIIIYVATDI